MIELRRLSCVSLLAVVLLAMALPAWAQSQLPFSQVVSQLRWRSIGPPIGGRVVAVSGVAQQPNVFYMGAVGGGIWKSDDYGASWENISDQSLDSSNSSIGSIAVAPSDPNIIYAGTGEADIRNDFITGNGMYKSTDAGKSWKYIGLKDTHTTSDIVVDPRNPDVVYMASLGHVFVPNSEGGVYKTTDGGQSWKKVLFVDDKTGAIDLAMNPQAPEVLYAAMWQVQRQPWKLTSGGPGSGLYKTTDGGAHWSNISRNPGLPQGILGRIGVAVAPSQPNIVYAIVQAKQGGLFRSEDGGQHWQRVSDNWELRQRGFYYSTVYVDPKDPNTIYLPQVTSFWVSHDGGKTISKLHTPHGDNHIAWINPNNPQIILEGNDGGATVSVNGGRSWSTEFNQPTGEFYHVNLDDQFPFHVYGAQQDESSIEGPSSSLLGEIPFSAWQGVAGGESSWVVPQPGKPWITYASGYYTLFAKQNRKNDLIEGVSPWPDYQSAAASEELKYRLAWTHPILFSPSNPEELLVGAQCVLKSLDYGDTWTRISPDLTRNDKSTQGPTGGPVMLDQSGAEVYPYISGLAVSPLDNDVIWTGSSDGLVHVTTNGGQHWSNVTPPQMENKWGWVWSIAASYAEKGTAYVSFDRYQWDDFKPYVFKTTDYGRHWSKITQGLPDDAYVMSIAIDPHNRNLVFLGTRNTVYVSVNGGQNWEPLSLNLPHVQVRDIAIQPEQNSVVIATHGRAFWVLDDLALLEQLADGAQVASDSTYLFKPQLTWMTKSYGTEDFEPSPSEGENHAFGTTVFFHLPADYNGTTPVTLTFTTAAGQVVNSYRLHPKKTGDKSEPSITALAPGMNRFQWDLRYPGSHGITGYYAPPEVTVPLGNGAYDPDRPGPEIVPGTYYAVLHYGDQTQRAAFEVKLDPRLTTTQAELQARLELLTNITNTLNELTAGVNRALAVQHKLQQATQDNSGRSAEYRTALSQLKQAIGVVAQVNFPHASEADMVAEPKLRGRLAALFQIVSQAYVKPRKLDQDVYMSLKSQIHDGLAKLKMSVQKAQDALR